MRDEFEWCAREGSECGRREGLREYVVCVLLDERVSPRETSEGGWRESGFGSGRNEGGDGGYMSWG